MSRITQSRNLSIRVMWAIKIYAAYLVAILAWQNPKYFGAAFSTSES